MLLDRTKTTRNVMYFPARRYNEYTPADYQMQKAPKGRYWKDGEPFGGYRENDIPLEWIAYIERTEAEALKKEQ